MSDSSDRLQQALELMSLAGTVYIRRPDGVFTRVYEQLLSQDGFAPLESGVYMLDVNGPRIVPYTHFVEDVSANDVVDDNSKVMTLKWQKRRPAP